MVKNAFMELKIEVHSPADINSTMEVERFDKTSKTWFYKLPAAIFPIFYQKKLKTLFERAWKTLFKPDVKSLVTFCLGYYIDHEKQCVVR